MKLLGKVMAATLLFLTASACQAPTTQNTAPQTIGVVSLTPTTNPTSSQTCLSITALRTLSDSLRSTHILYQGYDEIGNGELWVISLADGKRRQLINYPSTPFGLGFLRDGQRFLLAEGGEVVLGNINGAAPQEISLTDGLLANFQSYSPIWNALVDGSRADAMDFRSGRFHSPDGQKIAIWQRGDKTLVILDKASGHETGVILTGVQDQVSGIWTTDGTQFLFTYTYGTPDNYSSRLFIVSSDGVGLHPLTPEYHQAAFHSPKLSPDEKKVAFSVSEGATNSLGILWLDDGKIQIYPLDYPLGSSLLYAGNKIWSPDSKWLAFFVDWVQKDIRILNIDTGDSYCVTQDGLNENLMDWR